MNLVSNDQRSEQSHAIAKRAREALLPIAQRLGARIQVAEVPPGPPVLQTLVAEVYGPDPARRVALARQVRDILQRTPGVVDTDWYVESPQSKLDIEVDDQKAAAAGLQPAAVASVVRMAGAGEPAGLAHDERAREDVPILMRLPRDLRGSTEALESIRLTGASTVSVGEVTRTVRTEEPPSIYHKNLQPVTYVTGDLAGVAESPVYAILQMNHALDNVHLPEGYRFGIFSAHQPFDTTKYAMKWDGEWHITYEVFRDLGIAFAAVLLLIYVLVVGWFQSFTTPLIIMAAIPFSLVGHPAGARGHGRLLHGDVDDRLHRGRRHRRAQLDHPGGLHRAARPRRHAARAGGRRRRRRAVPADGPHRGRRHRRIGRDPVRSDLPGPGDFADGR